MTLLALRSWIKSGERNQSEWGICLSVPREVFRPIRAHMWVIRAGSIILWEPIRGRLFLISGLSMSSNWIVTSVRGGGLE